MNDFDFKFKILSDKNLVVSQSSGKIALSNLLNEFRNISLDPAFKRDIHYFHDLRQIESIEGSLSDHEKFAAFAVSISSSEPKNVVFLIRAC